MQFHVFPPAASTPLAAAGVPIDTEWDGAAEFWMEKLEDLVALFGDAEYQAVRPSHSYRLAQAADDLCRKLYLTSKTSWTAYPSRSSLVKTR